MDWLTVLGGALEIGGFAIVGSQLARIQRREFGTPKMILRIRIWVRGLFRRPVTHNVDMSAGVSGGGGVRTRGRRRAAADDGSIEARIATLEENFGYLEGELDERTEEFEQSLDRLSQQIAGLGSDFAQQQREREERRRAELRSSLAWQGWGTGLFGLGAILSVLGNLS